MTLPTWLNTVITFVKIIDIIVFDLITSKLNKTFAQTSRYVVMDTAHTYGHVPSKIWFVIPMEQRASDKLRAEYKYAHSANKKVICSCQENVAIDEADMNTKTPLMLAAGRKHYTVIKYLKDEMNMKSGFGFGFLPKLDMW